MTASEATAWASSLPVGWRAPPLKRAARIANSNVDKHSIEGETPIRLCNYTDVYYNDYIHDALRFMEATATTSEIRRFTLRRGDVIITKDSEDWQDIAVPACVVASAEGTVCGYHLALLRPDPAILDGRFLMRALQAGGVREQFWIAAKGITRFGLGIQGVGAARIPLPPVPQQHAIADFLDRKTEAIDALIEKKERLIALLQEKRQALITQAVTKGLDPNVPMKTSGIGWLGDIPAHWEVRRLKHIAARLQGRLIVQPHLYFADEGVPIVFGYNIKEGAIDESGLSRISYDADKKHRRAKVRAGDLLTVRLGAPGVTAVVPPSLDGCHFASIMWIHQHEGFHPQWLCHCMNSPVVQYQIRKANYGAAQTQFNIRDAVNFRLPVPPLGEQKEIASQLDRTLQRLTAVRRSNERQIELLREYRQALITDAVTGKLDISSEEAA